MEERRQKNQSVKPKRTITITFIISIDIIVLDDYKKWSAHKAICIESFRKLKIMYMKLNRFDEIGNVLRSVILIKILFKAFW